MNPETLPADDDVQVGRVLSRREVLALLGGSVLVACAPAAVSAPSSGSGAYTAAFDIGLSF